MILDICSNYHALDTINICCDGSAPLAKLFLQRVRRLQAEAKIGINLLSAESRACIEAASELYCGIVDEVEKIEYQIFDKRAKTSNWRRLKVALPAYIKARNSR